MPNVTKKNLIIIKSIIVWKWNHLSTKNYFRKKKYIILQIYTQRLSSHLWFNGQQKSRVPGLNWNPCVKVGMSSLFINLILKIPHYFHMKVLNERISKWAHLSFYQKQFLRYLYLKFEKEVISLGKFSPSEIPESRDKIPNFWVFKIAF